MPQLLYPGPQYPLDRKLGGPQSQSRGSGKEKNSQPLLGIESPNPNHPVPSQSLHQLRQEAGRNVINLKKIQNRV